jgi:DNA-directed RNA polymerase delta subunit
VPSITQQKALEANRMAHSEEDVAILEKWKAQRDKLNMMIAGLEDYLGLEGASPSMTQQTQRVSGPNNIPSDAFLKMTIPDAAKKYFEMVRTPQTMAQIWEALKRGGLPHAQYNAVYTAIWRRESPKGIFFRVDEDENLWSLAEWYPSNPNVRKKAKPGKNSENKKTAKTVKAAIKTSTNKSVTLVDGCEKILRDVGSPIHISRLINELKERFNKATNSPNLSGTLRKDERFRNLGKNLWALSEWPPWKTQEVTH